SMCLASCRQPGRVYRLTNDSCQGASLDRTAVCVADQVEPLRGSGLQGAQHRRVQGDGQFGARLLLRELDDVAVDIGAALANNITSALTGVEQQLVGKTLARSERPVLFEHGQFVVGPRMEGAEFVGRNPTASCHDWIVFAPTKGDGMAHEDAEN